MSKFEDLQHVKQEWQGFGVARCDAGCHVFIGFECRGKLREYELTIEQAEVLMGSLLQELKVCKRVREGGTGDLH